MDTLCHELAHLKHFDHSLRFRRFHERMLAEARRLRVVPARPAHDGARLARARRSGRRRTMSRNMERLFDEAKRLMPGGVNSPVRAFGGVGGTPVFFEKGHGAIVTDADGREYIDYLGSWGPLIVGHAHPRVVAAIRDQAGKGTTFGAPTELETELARRVVALRARRARRCASCPRGPRRRCRRSASRARPPGATAILKVEGCYHGHVDSLLVKAGSGVLTLGIPGSPGVPPRPRGAHPDDPVQRRSPPSSALLDEHGKGIACLIVEPVAGNMGVVPPQPGWLSRRCATSPKSTA